MGISTTAEWQQPQQIDDRMVLMPGNHINHLHHGLNPTTTAAAATTTTAVTGAAAVGRVMETQQPLKCPRCDSTNTKFCYYNNYSLSQPRHFCKVCKRYWTRGGTLRNVPVGGGCRKNKRVKKPSSSSTSSTTISTTMAAMVSDSQSLPLHMPNFSLPASSSPTTIDPIFFGLHQNSTDLNIPSSFSSFLERLNGRSGSVDNYNLNTNFNNSLGLCFPTAGVNQDYNAGAPFQTPVTASTSFVHDFSLLGSSLSSSLIASTLRHPKWGLNSPGWTVGYDDIPASLGNSGGIGLFKGVKEEDWTINGVTQDGRLQWQIPSEPNQLEITVEDTNSFYRNVSAAGITNGWAEITAGNNCGSSVTPLI